MGKRPSAEDQVPPLAKSYNYKKTERTHEENQERAYIAASRRSDRSIEARIQSARQASEIHKLRTGKALRITEEIVRNEEMYEEEEDEYPRSFRLLAPHMQTSSAEFNNKIENFLINKHAMSQLVSAATHQNWQHENEVNRMFAEAFPNLNQSNSRMPSYSGPSDQARSRQASVHSPVTQPLPVQHQLFDPSPHHTPSPQPNFQTITYQPPPGRHSRGHSFAGTSPAEHRPDMPSPPSLSPGSHATTPRSGTVPYFGSFAQQAQPAQPAAHGFPGSAFTTELSNEVKLMVEGGMAWDGAFDPALNTPAWQNQNQNHGQVLPQTQSQPQPYFGYDKVDNVQNSHPEYFDMTPQTLGTNEEPAWENFLDDRVFGEVSFPTDGFTTDGFNMQ